MRNRMYGGVRGRKTKVGEKLLCFPPTRLPSVGASLCLSFRLGVGAQKKASRQGGFLVVDKERCYFFMMRVVAMPLAVATRTTYTPGARPSTLA